MHWLASGWFADPGAWLGRAIFEHGLAAILCIAFIGSARQFPGLLGERGLLPIRPYLHSTRFWQRPGIFGRYFSDRFYLIVAWTGAVLAGLCVAGIARMLPIWAHLLIWLVLYLLYRSIVSVGQRWYGFLWEMILCEATLLAVFIVPSSITPTKVMTYALAWLLFRIEFGAGLIKLRGDSCWRDLTCLMYHHETQPMPGPLSWYFHHLPRGAHKIETGANHVVQLIVPWFLFIPGPSRSTAALLIALTQIWLVLSGNFAWVNFLTIVLALSLLQSDWLHVVLPVTEPNLAPTPAIWTILIILFGAAILVCSWWPIRNMISKQQRMNQTYNPFMLCNSYGAFGSIGRTRYEVIIEGTTSQDAPWQQYEFHGKPGNVMKRPPQLAPHHDRLGWMLWFAALSPAYRRGWFEVLLVRLLQGEPAVLRRVRQNPFLDAPPLYIRAQLYEYRFTTRTEKQATKAIWHRTLISTVAQERRLRTAD
ncbi:MAG: lipase maturation factor family protein [Antricoccus sp.]